MERQILHVGVLKQRAMTHRGTKSCKDVRFSNAWYSIGYAKQLTAQNARHRNSSFTQGRGVDLQQRLSVDPCLAHHH